MKKTWMVGFVLCALLNFGFLMTSANACIGADGLPAEDMNCAVEIVEGEEPTESKEPLTLSVEEIDFGYFSQLGRTYTKTFVITNNTAQPIAVRLSAIKPDFEGLKDENKLGADWIAFVGGIKFFEIPANSAKTVGVRVVTPAEAKTGSQYAQIKVEDTTNKTEKIINIRMGVVGDDFVFGGSIASSDVAAISLDDKAHANAVVKNSGNAGFVAKYTVRVTPKFGLEQWKTIIDGAEAEVYPNSEHGFKVEDSNEAIGYGLYTVEQKIVYVNKDGEQIEETATRTVLNMPWWSLAILGGVIVLVIAVVVIVKIMRRKKDDYGDDFDDEEPKSKKEKKQKKAKKAKKNAKAELEESSLDDVEKDNDDGLGAVKAKDKKLKKERKVIEVGM